MSIDGSLIDISEKKEYQCQVTIIEARGLKTTNANGLCSPFVKITVADQPPQVTQHVQNSNDGAWYQSFTFTNLNLNQAELEKFEILLEVFDTRDFLWNKLIGSKSIGLSTLYKSMHHTYQNEWLKLEDPNMRSDDQGKVSSETRPSQNSSRKEKKSSEIPISWQKSIF